MKKRIMNSLAFVAVISFSVACKKNWLDAKPNKALVVPSAIADYQALLDAAKDGITPMNLNYPGISMAGDGDYFIADDDYDGLGYPPEKGAYSWAETAEF